MTDEVRVISESGGQKGQKEARFGGGDPLAYMELARVYGFGEQKYDRYNYLKGYEFSLSVDAMFRHLFAFLAGEDRDPESGLLHTSHVAWHGQALSSFLLRGIGVDDRPPVLADNVPPRTIDKAVVSEAWGTGDGPVFYGMPLKAWNAVGIEPDPTPDPLERTGLVRPGDLQACFPCGHMGFTHEYLDDGALGACYACMCNVFVL